MRGLDQETYDATRLTKMWEEYGRGFIACEMQRAMKEVRGN